MPGAPGPERGQALVEFSLSIIVFLVMLMAIFDFGRGIFIYNGVAEAAREIARATSVHPGTELGQSPESLDTVAIQRGLVPGIQAVALSCVDVFGTDTGESPCPSGSYVRVTVTAVYGPVSLLGLTGPIQLASSSSVVIP